MICFNLMSMWHRNEEKEEKGYFSTHFLRNHQLTSNHKRVCKNNMKLRYNNNEFYYQDYLTTTHLNKTMFILKINDL